MKCFKYLFVFLVFLSGCYDNSNTKTDPILRNIEEKAIPGERTCFWTRGPVSADPYMNIAYPDANVFYWAAAISVPEGAKLELEGEFPYCRYMSLISYDERGHLLNLWRTT